MKLVIMLCALLCASALAAPPQFGIASHYSVKSNGGTHTASGERLRDNSYTAAHRSLRFGTVVKVTNLQNGKSAVVRINNRGPYIRHRIIDVSQAAARDLGLLRSGIARVRVEVLKKKP